MEKSRMARSSICSRVWHAVHLLGGLIALFVVVFGRRKRRELVDVVAYYWHFLTVLWLILFEVLRTVT